MAVTTSGRNPGAAGCAAAAGASPALPPPIAPSRRRAGQQGLERRAPPGRERVDPQGAPEALGRVIGRIEEGVHLFDGHPLGRFPHLHDLVAGTHLAGFEDAEVEARPSARCQQGRHAGLVHPDADAIAGHARLGHLEQRAADPISVADADDVVGQAFDREVLAELSGDEVGPLQLLFPVAIRLELVDEDGALLTAVSGQIALAVPVHIQPAHPTAPRHRVLPDPGVHRAPLPRDVAWEPHVHG